MASSKAHCLSVQPCVILCSRVGVGPNFSQGFSLEPTSCERRAHKLPKTVTIYLLINMYIMIFLTIHTTDSLGASVPPVITDRLFNFLFPLSHQPILDHTIPFSAAPGENPASLYRPNRACCAELVSFFSSSSSSSFSVTDT